jgi:hypothetical protein
MRTELRADKDSKDEYTAKIIDHVTHGQCAEIRHGQPGCENVTGDPTVNAQRPVNLQIVVLGHVIDVASKKQMRVVLDQHEIDYGPTDTIKKLRGRLRNYIKRIERGKLKDASAGDKVVEKLRRLDDIRKNWPKLVPMSMKEVIVKNFREATSSASLAVFVCMLCT